MATETNRESTLHDGSQTTLKDVANLSEGQVSIGNPGALRDALLCILDIAARDMPNYCRSRARDQGETESIRAWSNTIVEIAKNALSKPFRQCDVGTVDEQNYRHGLWCSKHDVNGDMEADCANNACSQCILKWCQMPYTEGGAK